MYMRSCSVHPLDVPGDRNRHPSTLSRRWFGPPLTPSTGVKIQHRRPIFRNSTLKERTFHSIVLTGKEIWYCSLLHLIRSEHKERFFLGHVLPMYFSRTGLNSGLSQLRFGFELRHAKKAYPHDTIKQLVVHCSNFKVAVRFSLLNFNFTWKMAFLEQNSPNECA